MTDSKAQTEIAGAGPSDRLEAGSKVVARRRGRRASRLGGLHAGVIAASAVLVVLLVFILENAHSVNVGFLGAHLRLPLAVAMLLAGVGGALLVGTLGAARITQLRRAVDREVDQIDPLSGQK